MRVYISPSGQRYNRYAYGDTTEADQCRKIGHACYNALVRSGLEVKITPGDMSTENAVADSNAYAPDIHL